MAKLVWGDTGSRRFETGVDRGVLYTSDGGVPWNGLTSVKEKPTGGEPQPYYQDGIKYLELASSEEFEATIEAYSSPPEFDACDGTVGIFAGLFITQQPRKQFGFSYRSMIGNDVDGQSHGYKIHLVYNALARPTSRSNDTLSDTVSPMSLSWDISCVPPAFSGYKPTAHYVIDSTQTNKIVLSYIEAVLYGNDNFNARLPDPSELVTMFGWEVEDVDYPINFIGDADNSLDSVTNVFTNPSFESAGSSFTVRVNNSLNPNAVTAQGFSANNSNVHTVTKNVPITGGPQGITTAATSVIKSGQTATTVLSMFNVDTLSNTSASRYVGAWIYVAGSGYRARWDPNDGSWTDLPNREWIWFACVTPIPDNTMASLFIQKKDGSVPPTTDIAYITGVTTDLKNPPTEAIWGDRPASGDYTYAWGSSANASSSIQTASYASSISGANCAAHQSKDWAKSGNNSVRLTEPVSASATRAVLTLTFIPGQTYTVKATKRQKDLLTSYTGVYKGFMYVQGGGAGDGVHIGPQTDNAIGEQTIEWTFTVPSDANSIAFALGYGSGVPGSGDVWWDDVTIVPVDDDPYSGPAFSGSSNPFKYKNQLVTPKWDSTPDAGTSSFTYYDALTDPGNIGDAYIIDDNFWIFTNKGYWENFGPVPTAVDS